MRYVMLLIAFVISFSVFGQINYTAHDTIVPYQAAFGYGTNAGWFPPHSNWQISSLAAGDASLGLTGAGCRSIRGTIPHDFITNYGLFADMYYWQHNNSLGLRDNVAFIGFPHSSVEENILSCNGASCPVHNIPHKPGTFRGMYLPIWDGGANGTPVNDANTYAKYVYDIVTNYKDYVRFWEVWNEPDFSFSSNAYAPASNPNSWWNRSNFECDCPCMGGTIFDYIRLLRISWEVIKSVDSTAYVCTGGLGYPGFLDAVLRYTDNPADGSVTSAYPHKGGAYFDVMSFHVYPQYTPEVVRWSNSLGRMEYNRHSDGAANGVRGKKLEMQNVLHNRGYNGLLYPEKEWIITEYNISRRIYGDLVGGEETQRNFMLKTQVLQQLDGVRQSYVYGLAEKQPLGSASSSFDLMGIYEALTNRPLNQPLTSAGVANHSLSQVLQGAVVDKNRTAQLLLPSGVRGAAFNHGTHYTYVLWAETLTDRSELATASYSFPASLGITSLQKRQWNVSQTGITETILSQNISLSGTPAFFTELASLPVSLIDFSATLMEDDKVELRWETAFEQENDLFIVERSADGSLFEKLLELPARNSSNGASYLEFDRQPLQGEQWYRLSQQDLDGSITRLKTVSLHVGEPGFGLVLDKKVLQTGEAIAVSWSLDDHEPATLSLMAIEGRKMISLNIEEKRGEARLSSSGLAPGLYWLVLRSNSGRIAKKIQLYR
ncbi:MAG: hypothetical protein R3B47_05440 [Bacteroidia bacterium]